MKKVGILVAVEIEAVLKNEFKICKQINVGKFVVYTYNYGENEVYVIHSGAGQVLASAATEILISQFKVDLIINFGIVGSLRTDINLGNTCVIDSIVDYQFDTSEIDNCEVGRHVDYPEVELKTNEELKKLALSIVPTLREVKCASGNKFVGSSEEKQYIAKTFNCDIVEMEAAAILLVANMHDIPVVFIKGISDSVHGGADEFRKMFDQSSSDCYLIIKQILESLN